MIDYSFIMIQVIGAIGYTLLSVSFYRKDKLQILFMQIIANIFFTIHYYLLNGITGAVSNVIGLLSYTALYFFDQHKMGKSKNIFSLAMITLLLILTIVNYANIYSVLPFVAFVFTNISFLTGKEDIIRKFGIVAAICWLVYAIVYKSYVAIVFEVITLVATIGSLIKYPSKKEKSHE